jgi:integrase
MAHLVKQKKTYHVDAAGKRCPKDTPGGKKVTEESSKWYAAGVPGWPKGKRVPLATRKDVAQRMLADLVAGAERGQAHMPTSDLARASLADLLPEFDADMLVGMATKRRSARKRPSAEQVKLAGQRLRTLVSGCRFVTVADLNDAAPGKVAKYLTGRYALPRAEGGLSAESCECYRKVAVRFVWWLSVRKRAPVSPDLFADVPSFDAKNNRVHLRRVLTHPELAALLDATRSSGVTDFDLSGEDRYFLYSTAVATGLRAGELASLTPESFRLNEPTVALAAKRAKNKTAAVLPLTAGLARQLVGYLAKKPACVPVWGGTWARDKRGAEILRSDLERTGIPYVVDSPEGPRHADFHALRHTFVTSLAATGIGPKELQTLARHSDAHTTLSHYTHTTPEALAAAVGRLRLPGGEGDGNPLATMSRAELESCVVGLMGVVNVLLGQKISGSTAAAKPRAAA